MSDDVTMTKTLPLIAQWALDQHRAATERQEVQVWHRVANAACAAVEALASSGPGTLGCTETIGIKTGRLAGDEFDCDPGALVWMGDSAESTGLLFLVILVPGLDRDQLVPISIQLMGRAGEEIEPADPIASLEELGAQLDAIDIDTVMFTRAEARSYIAE